MSDIREHQRRATAEYLGGTKIRFHFPCGHSQTKDYSKGPVAKRMGEAGCRFMVKYWSTGGVTAECPRCKRNSR